MILRKMHGWKSNGFYHTCRSLGFRSIAVAGLIFLSSNSCKGAPLPWEAEDGFRSAPLTVDNSGASGFSLLPASLTGLEFGNILSDQKAAENQIRLNGSGVALGDIDGDGLCDVYLCNLEAANALFRNLGDWKFEKIDISGGPDCRGQYSTGAAFADVDGDGDLDLFVNGIGVGTRLFLNDGAGVFSESRRAGLVQRLGASSMAIGDIDRDGDLDLYVANYSTTTIRTTGFAVLNVGGKRMIRPQDRNRLEYTPEGRVLEHGEPDILYRNNGSGRFIPDSWAQGTFKDEDEVPFTKPPFDWGLSVMFRDIDGNGSPDLYVCNDFHSTDKIWINDGKGRFQLISRLALRNTSTFSMTVDFGDLDRDGFDDIFVADMLSLKHPRRLMRLASSDFYRSTVGVFDDRPQFDRNTIQWNRGDGTYAEIAAFANLQASEWTWSTILLDVDLDGFEDLLCSTGHMFDTQDLDAEARIRAKGPWRRDLIPQKLLMFPKMPQPKIAFRNRGDLTFEVVSDDWGFNQLGVAHGMALADLDNDGDLDVVVNNLNENAGVYRNDSPRPRVSVRLNGKRPNRYGIGARIKVSGGPELQTQEMTAGGRYLSGDEPIRVFAAGSVDASLSIEVKWMSGKVSVVEGAKSNRIYEIEEPGAMASNPKSKIQNPKSGVALFEDVSGLIGHRHAEEAFDDFGRQPLLPRKLSQLGPGVAWFDVNDDGWDDLIVGSGRGGAMTVSINDQRGGFRRINNAVLNQPVTRDQTGVLGWRKASGKTVLMFGSSNYEDGLAIGAMVRELDLRDVRLVDTLSGQSSTSGPLAMADVDADGDLDLFVGGRCVPGRWPEAAASFLSLNNNGNLQLDGESVAQFSAVGLVSGAVFSDLNGDGRPDLALACEWGPVRVFLNEGGTFSEATVSLGLEAFIGFWNGIHAGDFDGDGRLDLVASNWGFNSSYQTNRDSEQVRSMFSADVQKSVAGAVQPPLLYYGDFDGNTSIDIIEARLDSELGKIVPIRSLNAISQGLPIVRERFRSFVEFNEADVFQVGGAAVRQSKPLKATWLASTIFLNRGGHFEIVALPRDAQLSPGFGVTVADFDGDGAEDIFMSQNFFSVQPAATRLDAGRSVVLRGDGSGHFTPIPGVGSGVTVYGEGRGSAVADYDRDGRVDLVVAQNGAGTVLYHNVGARPGLRVRLSGPPGNPSAVGAVLRLIYGSEKGPVREIHAGSGYWSQDSGTVVLGRQAELTGLWVRWPGGSETVTDVPNGALEITLNQKGAIEARSEGR